LTATTIDTPWGERVTGVIRCWMGRRWIEVEDSDGRRHIGREPKALSTVDDAEAAQDVGDLLAAERQPA
jgi:hypothetical protein